MFSSSIGAFEAKTHFSQILERVRQGEEFTITLRGIPVAKIISSAEKTSNLTAQQAADQLRLLAKTITPAISTTEWQSWRDEGKR